MTLQSLHCFAGIGGAALGFQRGGIKPVEMCEIDPYCQRVLRRHWPHAGIHGDIRNLRKEHLSEHIDVITGGFPCQDISGANWKAGGLEGHRSRLWYEQLRLVDEVKPSYVVAENSPFLRSRGLDVLLRGLDEVGYDAEWHCVPASHVGAPHQRDRIFIIAYPNGVGSQGQGQLLNAVHPTPDAFGEADRLVDAVRTGSLPFVCRGHDGLPGGLERLKQLGNTVVPAIFESIARAIITRELLS